MYLPTDKFSDIIIRVVIVHIVNLEIIYDVTKNYN